MNNIKRYIYVWDTHWTHLFSSFINKYNDGKTFFYFLWDIFNRWNFSYENYETIVNLHKKGLCNMVLWNHDLFFILSKWFMYEMWKMNDIVNKNNDNWKIQRIKNHFQTLFNMNWWYQTEKSFILNFWWNWVSETIEVEKKYSEVANYLFENFDIYIIDHNNNLLIHWWIPILPNNNIVHIWYNNSYICWIELITKINEWFKKLDIEAISILDGWINNDDKENIISAMIRFLNIPEESLKYTSSRYLSPVWYDNSLYDTNKDIQDTLLLELDKNNINNIFLWHWHNKEICDSDFCDKTKWEWKRIFRLDRTHKETSEWSYWSIWYAIFWKDNDIIAIWTYK